MYDIKKYIIEADGCSLLGHPVVGSGAPQSSTNQPSPRRIKPFIKGPIDLEWIQRAAQVNATEVALWLSYKEGFKGTGKWFQMRPCELRKYGLTRKRRDRQIKSLETAGLIAVRRKRGQCPNLRSINKQF